MRIQFDQVIADIEIKPGDALTTDGQRLSFNPI